MTKLPVYKPGECSGHCCHGFYVHLEAESPEALIEHMRTAERDGQPRYVDQEFVADMLIPHRGPPPAHAPPTIPKKGYHTFDCKHFVDGRCSRYDERPQMCRDFGVRVTCTFEGCTFDPTPLWKAEMAEAWPDRRKPEIRKWLRDMVVFLREMENHR